jgi:hypothetical protein
MRIAQVAILTQNKSKEGEKIRPLLIIFAHPAPLQPFYKSKEDFAFLATINAISASHLIQI